ncbi:hypothetical protein [Sphingomonas sp.]|uniref:hypothetical protein n=1 Tax=Sphingomonas sp. TaxID=28214 RepID=UPI00307CFC18
MNAKKDRPLETIGFGGDGDQVDAFYALEKHFGVSLDDGDCERWVTAGDVFTALIAALPEHEREREYVWPAFANIMCDETGADASRLRPETLLLGLPLSVVIGRWFHKVFGT